MAERIKDTDAATQMRLDEIMAERRRERPGSKDPESTSAREDPPVLGEGSEARSGSGNGSDPGIGPEKELIPEPSATPDPKPSTSPSRKPPPKPKVRPPTHPEPEPLTDPEPEPLTDPEPGSHSGPRIAPDPNAVPRDSPVPGSVVVSPVPESVAVLPVDLAGVVGVIFGLGNKRILVWRAIRADGEVERKALAARLGMNLPAIDVHLRALTRQGLIRKRRQALRRGGAEAFYSIPPSEEFADHILFAYRSWEARSRGLIALI